MNSKALKSEKYLKYIHKANRKKITGFKKLENFETESTELSIKKNNY